MSWVLLAVSPDGSDERYSGKIDEREGLVYFAANRDGASVFENPEGAQYSHRCLSGMAGYTDYKFFLVEIDSDTRMELEPPPRKKRPKKDNRFFPNREL